MELTLNHIRDLLFAADSPYSISNRKDNPSDCDRFISELFDFLEPHPDTQKAFGQITVTGSTHDNFCRGKLRSDGYYPVRPLNDWICADLIRHRSHPQQSETISELKNAYSYMEQYFSSELTISSDVFTHLMTVDNCMQVKTLYTHLRSLLMQKEFLTVLAWMTVIAVFPEITSSTEKKPDLAKKWLDSLFGGSGIPGQELSLHDAYENFLKEKLDTDDVIEELIIVHNFGARDISNTNRNALLRSLIDRAGKVKILLTAHQIAEQFTAHIRQQKMCYISDHMPLEVMWRALASEYPDKIELRLSSLPAMHQYTEVIFRNPVNSAAFVAIYTIGGTMVDRMPFMILPHGAGYYDAFRREFDYSWEMTEKPVQSSLSVENDFGGSMPTSVEFVQNGIERGAEQIDLAFHAGSEWLMIDDKLAVISEIVRRKIRCRILINSEASVANIIPHMRSENKMYVGLTQTEKNWRDFRARYSDFIELRVSEIPLLHAVYHVKGVQESAVRIGYYTYDNAWMKKNYISVFSQKSPYYDLYAQEFSYLWEQAHE